MSEILNSEKPPRLIPVTEWNRHHQWPPQGGLRHLIFHADSNGFKSAFVRCGRRVLINEVEFFNCVARQEVNRGSAAA